MNTQVVLVEYIRGDQHGLAEKYEAIRKHFHLTTIVGVDTGGDKYGPEIGNIHATVDQDQDSFEAGRIVYHHEKFSPIFFASAFLAGRRSLST